MSLYSYGWSEWMCDYTNERIALLGRQFSLPDWNRRLRYLSDSLTDAGLPDLPVLSLLLTPAVYVWGVLILPVWILQRKRRRAGRIALLLPVLILLFLQFFGPVNGNYGRYLLPVTLSFPLLLLMVFAQGRTTDQASARQG